MNPEDQVQVRQRDNRIDIVILTHGKTTGESDVMAEVAVEKVLNIYASVPNQSFRILMDMTRPTEGKAWLSRYARGLYDQVVRHKQTERIAVVGKKSMENFIFKMVMNRSKHPIKWFDNIHAANMWLAE
ncbi:MAG: hypothetical protein O3B64_04085 [bacterium]|nr:hypothetical protein [bacterium]